MKQFATGKLDPAPQTLVDANVTAHVNRRIPFSNNQVLKQANTDFNRAIIVRYPKEGESTPQTRETGLNLIGDFLMDRNFSKFPPFSIEKEDITDLDNPPPLDKFFMDDQIKEFLIQAIDAKDLDESFVNTYPEFAKLCWSGKYVSDFARTLGFE